MPQRFPKKLDPIAYQAYRAQLIASVTQSGFKWIGLVACVYFGIYSPIEALAANETVANVAIDFVTDFKINTALAWVLGAGGVAYGAKQRKLRRGNVARLEGHIKKLEKRLDKRRTSSRLTQQGTTNPGDEL